MDWYLTSMFFFGALCVPGVPLFLLCSTRRRPIPLWSASVALLAIVSVVAGFPAAAVLPAAALGLLLGLWGVAELA